MLGKKVQDAINEQIKNELYSGYLYLAMSAYFEAKNLPGFAHWMRMQAEEEQEHDNRQNRSLQGHCPQIAYGPVDVSCGVHYGHELDSQCLLYGGKLGLHTFRHFHRIGGGLLLQHGHDAGLAVETNDLGLVSESILDEGDILHEYGGPAVARHDHVSYVVNRREFARGPDEEVRPALLDAAPGNAHVFGAQGHGEVLNGKTV